MILTGASRGFLWQTVWPQDCWQKRMLYLNTFRLHALLNATEIVLYYESGPPQPTSNISLLLDIKTTTQRKVLSGARYYWFRSKAILIFLQGIFSNSQVINSFSQIAYSISRTWISNKVFGFMWHTQVKGSNNCYGEKWKKWKHQYALSGKACCYVALPPRGVLFFIFVTVLDLFLWSLLAPTVTSIFKSFDAFLDNMGKVCIFKNLGRFLSLNNLIQHWNKTEQRENIWIVQRNQP